MHSADEYLKLDRALTDFVSNENVRLAQTLEKQRRVDRRRLLEVFLAEGWYPSELGLDLLTDSEQKLVETISDFHEDAPAIAQLLSDHGAMTGDELVESLLAEGGLADASHLLDDASSLLGLSG